MKKQDFQKLRPAQQRAAINREQVAAGKAAGKLLHVQIDAAEKLSAGLTKITDFLEQMNEAMPGSVDPEKLAEMKRQSEQNAALVESFKEAAGSVDEALDAADLIASMQGGEAWTPKN